MAKNVHNLTRGFLCCIEFDNLEDKLKKEHNLRNEANLEINRNSIMKRGQDISSTGH